MKSTLKVLKNRFLFGVSLIAFVFTFTGIGFSQEISPEISIYQGVNKQYSPVVAHDSVNNRYLAIFKNQRFDGSNYYDDIYGQIINPDGTKYGNVFSIIVSGVDLVNGEPTYPLVDESSLSVVFDSQSSKYLIAWSDQSGSPKLVGQLLDINGLKVGNPFIISTGLSSGNSTAYDSINNHFIVVWSGGISGSRNIYGQLVSPNG